MNPEWVSVTDYAKRIDSITRRILYTRGQIGAAMLSTVDMEALDAAIQAYDAASIVHSEDGTGVDVMKVARELVTVMGAARELVRQAKASQPAQ